MHAVTAITTYAWYTPGYKLLLLVSEVARDILSASRCLIVLAIQFGDDPPQAPWTSQVSGQGLGHVDQAKSKSPKMLDKAKIKSTPVL